MTVATNSRIRKSLLTVIVLSQQHNGVRLEICRWRNCMYPEFVCAFVKYYIWVMVENIREED